MANTLTRAQLAALAGVIALCQVYFQIVPCTVHPVDTMQDFAFVKGYALADLLQNQYQYYLYGFVPYMWSYGITGILSPLKAFAVTETLLSLLYSGVILALVFRFVSAGFRTRLLLSFVLICLLLNPGNPLFGWKFPYTIGNTFGVTSTCGFFLASLWFDARPSRRRFWALLACGVVAVSTKTEFAFITLAYYAFWVVLHSTPHFRPAGPQGRRAIAHAAIAAVLLAAAYLNWMKLLPPSLRISEWCSDPVTHAVLSREAMSGSGSTGGFMSNHARQVIGLMDFRPFRALDMAFQVALLLVIVVTSTTELLGERRRRIYGLVALTVYSAHILTLVAISDTMALKNLAVVTFALATFLFRRMLRTQHMLPLTGFAALFVSRTSLSVEFSFFSIYYMMPLVVLLLAIIATILKHRGLLALYTVLLCAVLSLRTVKQLHQKNTLVTSVTSEAGETYRVPITLGAVVGCIERIGESHAIQSLGSAKNIPFLNVYFNVPNPVKRFVNVEFYPVGFEECYRPYLEALENNRPDLFVYAEPIMGAYLTAEEHHGLSDQEFQGRSSRFKEDLGEIYSRLAVLGGAVDTSDSIPWPRYHIYY